MSAFERAVAQSSPTIRRVRAGFSTKLALLSRVSRIATPFETKDFHQVLCETLQVRSGHFHTSLKVSAKFQLVAISGRHNTLGTSFHICKLLSQSR